MMVVVATSANGDLPAIAITDVNLGGELLEPKTVLAADVCCSQQTQPLCFMQIVILVWL